MIYRTCALCDGKRLRPEILGVTVANMNIVDISDMTVDRCYDFFNHLFEKLNEEQKKIANQIIKEIKEVINSLK